MSDIIGVNDHEGCHVSLRQHDYISPRQYSGDVPLVNQDNLIERDIILYLSNHS